MQSSFATPTEHGTRRININLSERAYKDLRELSNLHPSRPTLGQTVRMAVHLFKHLYLDAKEGQQLYLVSPERSIIAKSEPARAPLVVPATRVDVGIFYEQEATPEAIKRVQFIPDDLLERLIKDPKEIYRLGGKKFEDLIRDRLVAMGYLVDQVGGNTYTPDGNVDFFIRSKLGNGLPVLGAIQVKHHSRPDLKCDVNVVRQMESVLELNRRKILMGFVVTNTAYSSEAQWLLGKTEVFLRGREGKDIQNWIRGNFESEDELRDMPNEIELGRRLIHKLNFHDPKKRRQ